MAPLSLLWAVTLLYLNWTWWNVKMHKERLRLPHLCKIIFSWWLTIALSLKKKKTWNPLTKFFFLTSVSFLETQLFFSLAVLHPNVNSKRVWNSAWREHEDSDSSFDLFCFHYHGECVTLSCSISVTHFHVLEKLTLCSTFPCKVLCKSLWS